MLLIAACQVLKCFIVNVCSFFFTLKNRNTKLNLIAYQAVNQSHPYPHQFLAVVLKLALPVCIF